ncbi:MAG TPA: hypothetical protein VII86_05635, partial [Thermoanaerobaculia bacterium]
MPPLVARGEPVVALEAAVELVEVPLVAGVPVALLPVAVAPVALPACGEPAAACVWWCSGPWVAVAVPV